MEDMKNNVVEEPVDEGSAIEKFNSAADRDLAYAELEREFTKRSQKLKDLQLENDQLRAEQAEQKQQERFDADVDQFIMQFPEAVAVSEEMADVLEAHPDWQGEEALLKAYAMVLSQKQAANEQLKADESFIYEAMKSNLGLRDKIVNDYFANIPQSVKLPSGSGIPASSYNAPRTIEDAGKLLEEVLKGQ